MTHEELKQKALNNTTVKKEYDDLELEFQLLNEMLYARKVAGLNQSQVADIMGTKQAAITRLESALSSGLHSPSLATLKKYATAVGCHLDIKFVHNQVVAV
ncbi:MAG: helix-turn-helix transcriptional regulator [Campylobacterota bacterium]|nr:helix-turn-helix transcriptional regulator [Campylobacterota bacterium]